MKYSIKDFLSSQVKPALGCTEPVAVALAAASATALLPKKDVLDSIQVRVSPNIFKNGLAVAVPGTNGQIGLDLAAALGAVAGRPEKKMEVLDQLVQEEMDQAFELVRGEKVKIEIAKDHPGVFAQACVFSRQNKAEALIDKVHDQVTLLKLNNEEVKGTDNSKASGVHGDDFDLDDWLQAQSLAELLEFTRGLDEEDIEFLLSGAKMNYRLAEYGLKDSAGLKVGSTLARLAEQGLLKQDLVLEAKILTAAAADARMSGCSLPAMSSAGSGNNGLTAVLPIYAARKYFSENKQDLAQALALSHLITAQAKTYTGKLSPICTCSVAAGAGAAAGICLLMGCREDQIKMAASNLIADLGGVFCDGAKPGCALKLATAAESACTAALLASKNVHLSSDEGILGMSLKESMANLGRICREGMVQTDETILNILMQKKNKT